MLYCMYTNKFCNFVIIYFCDALYIHDGSQEKSNGCDPVKMYPGSFLRLPLQLLQWALAVASIVPVGNYQCLYVCCCVFELSSKYVIFTGKIQNIDV